MKKLTPRTLWIPGIAIIFLLYALLGFFALPPLSQYFLAEKINPQLGLNITIEKISTNPFTFEIELKNIEIAEPGETPYLKFKRLYTNLTPLSLLNDLLEIDQLTIEQPEINAVLSQSGELNLLKPVSPDQSEKADRKEPENPLIWKINTLNLSDGLFLFTYENKKGDFKSTSKNIDLSFYNLHSDKTGMFELKGQYDETTPVKLKGRLNLSPVNLYISLAVNQLDLKKLSTFPDIQLPVTLDQGWLSAHINFSLLMDEQLSYGLDNSQFEISQLNLYHNNKKEKLFSLSQFMISDVLLDSRAQQISIGHCQINKPYFDLIKNSQGQLSLPQAGSDSDKNADATSKPEPSDDSWQFDLTSCHLSEGQFNFTDQSVKPTVTDIFSDISFQTGQISSQSNTTTTFSGKIHLEGDGRITTKGQFQIHEKIASLDFKMNDRSLVNTQSYLNNYTDLKMLDGKSDTDLHIEYNPNNNPTLTVQGDLTLKQFQSEHAKTAEPVLAWDEIKAHQLNLTLEPSSLTIPLVTIKGSDSRIAINKEGQLNLLTLLKIPENTRDVDTSKAEQFPIAIEAIEFNDNKVRFSDDSLLLPFITHISKVNGSIKPLQIHTSQIIPSDITLKGQINEFGEARLDGSINTAQPNNHTQLDLSLQNIALNDLTPYSGTFSGYELDAGKLDTRVKYKVSDNQLDSQNNIVIRDIQLGKIINKEKAGALPIELAIALMKDSNNVIDIELPVHGDMSDPEFKYTHLIGQAISNLFTKVVTAPFALLKGLGGSEHNLEHTYFVAGQHEITPIQKEALTHLAEALKNRPALQLQIPVCSNLDHDKTGLKKLKLSQALNQSKQNKVEFYKSQYIKLYGQSAHKKLVQKHSSSEKNGKQLNMADYIQAMETALLDKQSVSDDAINKLAEARYESIRSYLITEKNMAPERLVKGKTVQGSWKKETIQCEFNLSVNGQLITKKS